MQEYKYLTLENGSSDKVFRPYPQDDALLTLGYFNQPLPCSVDFFIQAFIMPIKHQLKERVCVLIDYGDRRHFSVNYNNAHLGDHLTEKELMERRIEAAEVRDKVLYHMDHILDHMLGGNFYADTIPFGEPETVIKSVDNGHIRMNGRLPMQEDYFVRYYWTPLCQLYQKAYPGIRMYIHFDNQCQDISVTALYPRHEAYLVKHDVDAAVRQDFARRTTQYQVELILTDLADLVVEACQHYRLACQNAHGHTIPAVVIVPSVTVR